MAKTTLNTPQKGEITLKRYPHNARELLQAWDSADELILAHLADLDSNQNAMKGKRILILNDSFGALSVALADADITSYTDSYVSAKAIELNSKNKVIAINDLDKLSDQYDYVIIKLPNNLSFFADQLCHLSAHLNSNSKIIVGAMLKHLPKTTFELLEKYIGKPTTSLAQKKARLIFADFQKAEVKSPYPLSVAIEGFSKNFIHHSNLFSREKLDIGTRFLLDHIPQGNFKSILDLGCANGVVGIKAKQLNSEAQIIFSDDSFMAIKSAQANYQNQTAGDAQFIWTNCYEKQPKDSLDLVICNPPFHQKNVVGDFIAHQMFTDSHQALKKGAFIRVIGNSHLGYQLKLKKIFGNSTIVKTNQKFMIVDAFK